MDFSKYVCSSCRAYGIKLVNNMCLVCIGLGNKPINFKPSRLPHSIYDVRMVKDRVDIRTTRKKEYENDL